MWMLLLDSGNQCGTGTSGPQKRPHSRTRKKSILKKQNKTQAVPLATGSGFPSPPWERETGILSKAPQRNLCDSVYLWAELIISKLSL